MIFMLFFFFFLVTDVLLFSNSCDVIIVFNEIVTRIFDPQLVFDHICGQITNADRLSLMFLCVKLT